MWLPDVNVRSIRFTINAKNIRLIRSRKSLVKLDAKILLKVPLRAKPVNDSQGFTNGHISR